MDLDQTLMKNIISYILAGVLGSIGGMASYLHDVDRGKRSFSFASVIYVSIIGLVMGAAAGSFVPADNNLFGITLFIGLVSYRLLSEIKERLGAVADKLLERVFGDKK